MPAYPPGAILTPPAANPSAGTPVIFDGLSGPSGSPLDAKKFDYSTGSPLGWNSATKVPILLADSANLSTGGLSTGIGFGASPIFGPGVGSAPLRFGDGNFTDDYTPGVTKPAGTSATDSTYMYIGGGRSLASGVPNPYTAGFGICFMGNSAPRDGSTRTTCGFPAKLVTSPAGTAVGVAIETGYLNRSGVALLTGQSAFAPSSTENVVGALRDGEDEEVSEEAPSEQVPFEELETEQEVEQEADEDEAEEETPPPKSRGRRR